MRKPKTVYICQKCGYKSHRWQGRCGSCLEWNTMEQRAVTSSFGPAVTGSMENKPKPISELSGQEEERLCTGISEFDRVLGGGIVPGSVVLIGGDPGIGKSTLLLQTAGVLSDRSKLVLYVSGEESLRQIKLRGERIGANSDTLLILAETMVEKIIDSIGRIKPDIVMVDSVQSIFTGAVESSPGSVNQVRESAARLIREAKHRDLPLFMVGHVTKDGSIAGPRMLEHMVDTVLYFEGENGHPFRILRSVKNRFGSVLEIGVFEMRGDGLREVANPSLIFLGDMSVETSGSIVSATVEGTRPILTEIQSLVCPTLFGMPRRTTVGIDHNRVAIILAILEKKGRLDLGGHDLFLKISGGIKVDEPAIDLAVALAVASNFLDIAIDRRTVAFGEVGLTGEVRIVGRSDLRIAEATKLGFKKCILPSGSIDKGKYDEIIDISEVASVNDAMTVLFGNSN